MNQELRTASCKIHQAFPPRQSPKVFLAVPTDPSCNPPPPHSQNSLKDKLKLVPLIKILAADGNDVDVMWPVRAVFPLQWTVPELTNPGQRGVT